MDPAQELETAVLARQKPMYEAMNRGSSSIQLFYKHSVLFLTGASGFLGKHIVEKILRSSDVKKIYILLRSKKGETLKQRLDAILKDPLFDYLRQHKPQFADQLEAVEGDITQISLGIRPEDWTLLADEVDIIMHVAATTRFDETLVTATLTNVRGTREALRLGHACKHLKSFVYVSTAFAHATESRIGGDVEEMLYPSPMPPAALIQLAEEMDPARLQSATKNLIKGWPNTYVFTKAVAEEQVRLLAGDLPICIVKPPVVMSSYMEPSPGWIDMSAVFGPSGIIIGIGLGALHVILSKNIGLNLAPVDFVNNAIAAAAWDTAVNKPSQLPVYTVSSSDCQISIGLVSKVMRSKECLKYATPKAVWFCYAVETQSQFLYWLLTWILHYIPAYLVDGVCFLLGIKLKEIPSAVKIYRKIYKMSQIYTYFLTNEWKFKDDNLQGLFKRMSATDQLIYNFNIRGIDWKEMIFVWCIGLRKFVIKDGLNGSVYGQKKQYYLKTANIIFLSIYFFVFWKILSFIYSIFVYVFF